jgi:thiamine-monophosphate kinase
VQVGTSHEAEYDSFLPLPERELISRIRRLSRRRIAGIATGRLIAGIGDDCAVVRIPAGHEALVTTDFSLEGVHFRREWHSPQFIGHRCLTRGLSDIAAMGGKPLAAFLSLALPAKIPQRWVDGFLEGLLKLAKQFNVPLAGGDTTQSPGKVLADIVVLGSVPTGKAVLRSGSRAGDRIYVTGDLGGAAAEVDLLYSRRGGKRTSSRRPSFVPRPRINLGRILRQRGIATAMIDISDGLSTDLSHICEESGVGAEVWVNAVPRADFHKRPVDLRSALHGGDAYELLFTAAKRTRVPAGIEGVKISAIGEITRGEGMTLVQSGGKKSPFKPQGWQYFG